MASALLPAQLAAQALHTTAEFIPFEEVAAAAEAPNTAGETIAEPNRGIQIGFETIAGEPRYASRSDSEGGAAIVRFSATRPRSGSFAAELPDRLPLASSRITSPYGLRRNPVSGQMARHSGVDLAAATGTPVHSTADGTVVFSGWAGNYGLLVTVAHDGGMQTRYAHLSAISVQRGDEVSGGQMLGRSGSTGRSTGPHLHYEVRIDGRAVNPVR
ncbi:M23 family metallopeptidase [Aurantiacibacter sp. MUD61]|uniref:M23 family metallopeptidase n=1 Tax=Aurantiacibacter sp. MUD61 TaxID=3009083 RepID=UPI0022F0BA79|nr:M23 family metallopeptidase [Aurantiacibacter sp. MUD61]